MLAYPSRYLKRFLVATSNMENLKTEINVSTWLGVIAEMARSRMKHPELHNQFHGLMAQEIARFDDLVRGQPECRRALLRIAALAIRMADEHYPGDGLEF